MRSRTQVRAAQVRAGQAAMKRHQNRLAVALQNQTRDTVAQQEKTIAEIMAPTQPETQSAPPDAPRIEDIEYRLRFVRAQREHRAGKCYLYNDAPVDARNAIGARILVVKVMMRDGYIEILGYSPDYQVISPGDILPHYRWMYATDNPSDVSCVREDVTTNNPPEALPSPLVSEREGRIKENA